MLRDYHTDVDDRAGVGEWLKKLRDNLVEAKDRSLEVTLARPGGLMFVCVPLPVCHTRRGK